MPNSKTQSAKFLKPSFSINLINIGIIGVILLIQLVLAYNQLKFNRAEVFFAECAREMVLKSNFITPLFHGNPFFDKPILTYWLIILSFKVFGQNHLSARIPSILASLLINISLVFFLKKNSPPKLSSYVILILNSALLYLSFTVSCMSDMLLVLFDTLTLILMYLAVQKNQSRYLYLASVSMAFAFLVKGPVGVILPGLSFLVYLAIVKKLNFLKPRHFLWAGLIFLLLTLPWFILVYLNCGIGAINYFFFHENISRYLGSNYDTHKPIYFMLEAMFLGLLPWSPFLPIAFYNFLQDWLKRKSDQFELFAWIFTIVLIVFFSLSRGKIDYYLLPIYPLMAVIIGKNVIKAIGDNSLYAYVYSFLLSMATLTVAVYVTCIAKFNQNANILLVSPFVILFLVSLYSLFKKKLEMAFITNFICIYALNIVFAFYVLPNLNKFMPAIQYGKQLALTHSVFNLGIYGSIQNKWFDELTFSTRCQPVSLNNEDELKSFVNSHNKVFIIGTKSELSRFLNSIQGLKIIQSMPNLSQSLNPSYWFKHHDKVDNSQELMLIEKK